MTPRAHIDLFTGLGGFTLAARANGLETVVMCEKDNFCREGLKRAWPGIPIIEDVREFDGTKWTGAFILTAGVPCQPASRAGKQRGKDDVRWLWDHAVRVVGEAQPAWCLFENPPGIGDVGLSGILTDLEGEGYEVRVIGIPACAVNSPQLRNRYWILAKSNGRGSAKEHELRDTGLPTGSSQGDMADPHQARRQRADAEPGEDGLCAEYRQGDLADTQAPGRISLSHREEPEAPSPYGRCGTDFWGAYEWTPCADGKVRRTPDFTECVVDGVSAELPYELVKHLPRKILAGLGNSIVWPVAREIIQAIVEADS